jgi:hypothetical protein
VRIASKIRNLWRFDGDDEPIRVSRRSFIFMGSALGAATLIPNFVANAMAGEAELILGNPYDISVFLAAMTPNGGKIYPIVGSSRRKGLAGPEELPALATRFDPKDPKQWETVVVPMKTGTHTSAIRIIDPALRPSSPASIGQKTGPLPITIPPLGRRPRGFGDLDGGYI